MELKDDYKFLRIIDAFKTLHLHVNLIGVIVELGFPNASDCSCTLKIADPWSSGFGLPVQFLSLPRIESIGDIILLSRVKMMLINGKMTAVFHESFSSFALFKGKSDDECFIPYQSSPKFQMREQDKAFISYLREWVITYTFEEGSCCFTPLKDIKEGEYLNLSGQIVYISKEDKDKWFIFVWDGTDTPPCGISTQSCRLPLHIEPKMLPINVLRQFPAVGSVLRVIVDKVCEKQAIHCLKPGQHVKFLNLFCQENFGLWSAVLTPSTKILYAMDAEMQTAKHKRLFGERSSSGLNHVQRCNVRPHSGITGVAHEDAPFVTLMDILTCHNVTAKFRCVVRILAAYPWNVKNFRDSDGKYKVLFILEDATARIRASLYAYEGERFFGVEISNEGIAEKLKRVMGRPESESEEEIEDVVRNPPWVQCCLFSYYKEKKDPWGSRKFRMFDTWIN